jgi:tetratricopeptide (TPR) repeat protein
MPPKLKGFCVCLLLAVSYNVQADEKLVELVKKVSPAVVVITTFDANGQPVSTASGFFINDKNRIITNHHVIKGAYSATVKTSSGREYAVEGVVAKDIEADIVKLSVNIPESNIIPLKLSTSIPSLGEDIIVIGNPLGLESSVSTGRVSAVRGDIPAVGKILQITAPISSGSSGSPVLNTKGEVIGIATFIAAEGQNLNFAVPSEKNLALKETEKTTSLKEYTFGIAEANDAELLYIAGVQQLWKVNNFATALVYFQKATAKNPQHTDAWFQVGRCYLVLDRWQEAIEAFKETIRIKPDCVGAYMNLGIAYFRLGRYEEAIEAYKQAIRIKSDLAWAYSSLGSVYLKLNRYQDAVDACKRAIRIKPDFAEAHCNLGLAYSNLSRWEESIEAYKQAIKINPDFAEAYTQLGFAYENIGHNQEAIETYKQAIKINLDDANTHYNLGVVYLIVGDKDSALEEYKILKTSDVELANKLFNLIYE